MQSNMWQKIQTVYLTEYKFSIKTATEYKYAAASTEF
jgi:hypothetical protein